MTQNNWNVNDDEAQVPLGVGGDNAAAEETFGESKPKISGSTAALFASFAAAVLVIWLLGMQGKPREASAEAVSRDAQIDSALAELIAKKNGGNIDNLFKDTDKLVAMFYNYLNSTDTTLSLPTNPFEYEGPRSITSGTKMENLPVAPTNTAELEKFRRVAETFNGLKLQSVMIGRSSMAMINNRLVGVGARFGELTVSEIDAGRVILTCDNHKFELKLNRQTLDK